MSYYLYKLPVGGVIRSRRRSNRNKNSNQFSAHGRVAVHKDRLFLLSRNRNVKSVGPNARSHQLLKSSAEQDTTLRLLNIYWRAGLVGLSAKDYRSPSSDISLESAVRSTKWAHRPVLRSSTMTKQNQTPGGDPTSAGGT